MKVCRDCNVEKSLSDFYRHEKMFDGHLNKCKSCVKSRVNKHRIENIEKVREYDKKRSMLPHRVQARKSYQQTEQGKLALKKARKNYKEKYPIAYAAHVMTRNAIRDGKIKQRKTCTVCRKKGQLHAHHDDYTKPFAVRWLCIPCHVKWHKENIPIYE